MVADLHADMGKTIEHVDRQIAFLSSDAPEPITRKSAIISAQAWPFASTEEGKEWANADGCPVSSVSEYVDWLSARYPWPVRSDPVKSWRKRQESLQQEKNPDAGLKKYADFMRQTEDFRALIDEAAAQLDAYIQHETDVARGK